MAQEEFKLSKPLNHIAFIMDGNGRRAKKRLLPRTAGHKEGCKRIIENIRSCQKFGIKAVSLYAFSTENWNRPQKEIDLLFEYLKDFFNDYIDEFLEKGVRVMVSGEISRLPFETQEVIKKGIELTKDCSSLVFNICLNYGSRQEIVRAAKLFAEDVKNGNANIDDLDNESFKKYLYTNGLPEIDLVIRTSGENRLSNFLLYQLAYAEFVFTPIHWPDFKEKNLIECIHEFETRDRRFGKIVENQ